MKAKNTASTEASADTGTISAVLRARKTALSAEDLASLLSVSRQYIYSKAQAGTIPCRKLPGAIRFDPTEIAAWWDSLF